MIEMARRNWLVIVVLAAILILVGFNSLSQVQATQEKQEAQQTTIYVVGRADDVCTGEEDQTKSPELAAFCTEVDQLSEDLPETSEGATGTPGRPPTEAEIRAAVEAVLEANPSIAQDQIEASVVAYLRANPPDPGEPGEDGASGTPGEDGENGADGQNATDEQVAAAVAAYCAEGACVGPEGEPGEDGEDGQNATNDQVKNAVEEYCADDVCKGPKGDPGEDSTVPGPEGPPGSTECPDGFEWHEEFIENSSIDTGTYWFCKLVE